MPCAPTAPLLTAVFIGHGWSGNPTLPAVVGFHGLQLWFESENAEVSYSVLLSEGTGRSLKDLALQVKYFLLFCLLLFLLSLILPQALRQPQRPQSFPRQNNTVLGVGKPRCLRRSSTAAAALGWCQQWGFPTPAQLSLRTTAWPAQPPCPQLTCLFSSSPEAEPSLGICKPEALRARVLRQRRCPEPRAGGRAPSVLPFPVGRSGGR